RQPLRRDGGRRRQDRANPAQGERRRRRPGAERLRAMRGTLRWARADLRARWGQALVTIAVVAGVVTALFLATMLLQGAVNPWQQLFARTRGADVLIYFASGTNTGELRYVAGIQATAKPYQAASATLEQGAVRSQVDLRA